MPGTGEIHAYYGHGEGKTTAAVGQAVRAAGSGLKVLVYQFLKDNSSGEREILGSVPGITCLPGKEHVKFLSRMDTAEKAELKKENEKKLDEIGKLCGSFDMVILDEVLCAVWLEVLEEDSLVRFLQEKRSSAEIILTGHEISGKVLGIAGYATEFKKVKHPFDKGLKARKGIEY